MEQILSISMKLVLLSACSPRLCYSGPALRDVVSREDDSGEYILSKSHRQQDIGADVIPH